jgi:hypothetical protein
MFSILPCFGYLVCGDVGVMYMYKYFGGQSTSNFPYILCTDGLVLNFFLVVLAFNTRW